MTKPIHHITDHRVAQALGHPLRVAVLSQLENGPSSPVELSRTIGANVENLSYHVRKLRDLGFIEAQEHVLVRGAVKHVYRLVARPQIDDDVWAQMPSAAREALLASSMQESWRMAAAAAAQGGMNRPDVIAARFALHLDDQGFKEVSSMVADLLERIQEAEQRAAKRLHDDGTLQCNGTLVTLFFETPDMAVLGADARADGHHDSTRHGARQHTESK
jgi:DNA-binding transcriptional ArsR family regulator